MPPHGRAANVKLAPPLHSAPQARSINPANAYSSRSTARGEEGWRLICRESDYRMLPTTARETLLAEIVQSIDRHSGAFDMDYETHLYIARRIDRG
jgi:hypothetical protein